MSITIHQRVHGWLWHWRTGPGWIRDEQIRELRRAGMRALRVQLQDDGEIPRDLVDFWTGCGFKVWGAVRPSNAPLHNGTWTPEETAAFIKRERVRLGLHGVDLNFEREVRDADASSGGNWSARFVPEFRRLCPTLPAALDTVYGDFAGGINNVYTPGIRFNVQTYWGAEGIWDDPPTNIVKWIAGAQPVIPKANTKPLYRTVRNNAGEVVNRATAIADQHAAGLIGASLYYIDGTPLDELVAWTKALIDARCAY